MAGNDDRPGVTSPLYSRYAQRTAATHAAFVLPHLQPGMTLLDMGCGLGSITLGLAEAVAPGQVVGIDLNEDAVGKAKDAATDRGIENVIFQAGSCYELPFDDASFDAAFAHMVLMHLDQPERAVAEAFRVLRPSGLFAAADRAEQGDVRGNPNPTIERAWEVFMLWHGSRGSDLRFGIRLPAALHNVGFANISAAPGFHSHLSETLTQFSIFFTSDATAGVALQRGWLTERDLEDIRGAIQTWGSDPATFWGLAYVDAIGWKP